MPRSYGTTNAQVRGSAPAPANAGDTYYNTATATLYWFDGTAWNPCMPYIKAGITITGGVTAQANTFNVIALPSGAGTVTITLPAAPMIGTVIQFVRTDTNVYNATAQFVAGSGDTIAGASPYLLAMANSPVTFYYGSGSVWYVAQSINGAGNMLGVTSVVGFTPNIMARDSNGRAQVNDPAVAADIATKSYVDSKAGGGNTIRTATGAITANAGDVILADVTSGGFIVTIPVAAGARVVVKKIDASSNIVTVACSGTIDGDANATLVGQDAAGEFIGDGTNCQVVATNAVSVARPTVEATVQRLTAQSFGSTTTTAPISWDTFVKAVGCTTSASGVTITTAGRYLLVTTNVWTGNAAGRRGVFPWVNGAAPANSNGDTMFPSNALPARQSVSFVIDANVGDVVSIGVFQDSGATLTVSADFNLTQIGT